MIYIIKQDIYIYMLRKAGRTAGPIRLKFFCGHSWVAWECLRQKNRFFFQIFFPHLFLV